ncbi:MAG: hypothetical protein AB7T63_03615 [Planctomycetota bacterium]
MVNQNYGRKRHGGASSTATAIMITLLAVCGGALLLHSTGAITLPFLTADTPPPAPAPDPNSVEILVVGRPIPAYAEITGLHVTRPNGKGMSTLRVNRAAVAEDMLTSFAQVVGRVARHDLDPMRVIRQSDLYPIGTRPGPTAGIPAGKRAMRLKASDIPGLHGLNQGDEFDVVMTTEVEIEAPKRMPRSRASDLDIEGPYAPLHAADQEPPPEAPTIKRRMAEVKVVVEGGTVVQPVHRREEVAGSAPAVRPNPRNKPLEEIVIAIDPAEVAALEQALALGARIQVAMRGQGSSKGGDAGRIPDIEIAVEDLMPTPVAPTSDAPKERVRLVEVVEGGVKRIKAVPIGPETRPDEPTPAPSPTPSEDAEEPVADESAESGEEESVE